MTTRKPFFRGIVMIALAAVTAGATATSTAATPVFDAEEKSLVTSADKSDIDAFLATLAPVEREVFLSEKVPARTEEITSLVPLDADARRSAELASATGEAVAPMATGCWWQRGTWASYARAGNKLYSYYHVGKWCASGSRVTSAATLDYGGEAVEIGWRYEGRVKGGAGVVSNQGRSYTQVKFVLGIGGWDLQTSTPCGATRGYYTAKASVHTKCGIYY